MPVPLQTDFTADALRVIARKSKDGPQARRLLALAAIYEGASRTEAARIGGVTRQIVRDWVVKLTAHGPEGLPKAFVRTLKRDYVRVCNYPRPCAGRVSLIPLWDGSWRA